MCYTQGDILSELRQARATSKPCFCWQRFVGILCAHYRAWSQALIALVSASSLPDSSSLSTQPSVDNYPGLLRQQTASIPKTNVSRPDTAISPVTLLSRAKVRPSFRSEFDLNQQSDLTPRALILRNCARDAFHFQFTGSRAEWKLTIQSWNGTRSPFGIDFRATICVLVCWVEPISPLPWRRREMATTESGLKPCTVIIADQLLEIEWNTQRRGFTGAMYCLGSSSCLNVGYANVIFTVCHLFLFNSLTD